MGYCANINGYIKLKDKNIKTNEDLLNKIKSYRNLTEESALVKYMNIDAIQVYNEVGQEGSVLDFTYDGNYNDTEWYEILKDIQAEVEEGSTLECNGDDYACWRFKLTPNGWYEQQGYTAYVEGFKI